MFVEAGSFIAKLAWEHKATLLEHIPKLLDYLKNGPRCLVVFGSGGVGKTTVGNLLSGSLDLGANLNSYIESENTETLSLKSKVYASLLVAAGQERRRDVSWNDLFQKVSAGDVAGILNVVAWGCHSIEGLADYKEHKVYLEWKNAHPNDSLSIEDFAKLFQQAMLEEELQALKIIEPHLTSAKNRIWMLTVVAKQDLWWDKRYDVKSHYQSGEYEEVIASIRLKRGQSNFYHEYVSASFKWENLMVAKDTLASTVAGYDDRIQRLNLSKLSQSIKQLVENHK